MNDKFSTFYKTRQSILCICPKCRRISRLSQLIIVSKKSKEKTWLDNYDEKIRKFLEKKAEFEEQESDIKKDNIMRGREKMQELVNSALSDKVISSKYNPYDIKPINHPIDYIIYDGMEKGSVENVILLHQRNEKLAQLHKSIHDTIENKKYDWKVARISKDDGKLEIED